MNININDYLAYLNVATLIVLAIIAFKHYLLTRHRKSKLNQYAKDTLETSFAEYIVFLKGIAHPLTRETLNELIFQRKRLDVLASVAGISKREFQGVIIRFNTSDLPEDIYCQNALGEFTAVQNRNIVSNSRENSPATNIVGGSVNLL